MARTYEGPFDPPTAEQLKGAIAWRFRKRYPSPDRWEPDGFEIVFPDGILTLDRDGMGVRDSILYAA